MTAECPTRIFILAACLAREAMDLPVADDRSMCHVKERTHVLHLYGTMR